MSLSYLQTQFFHYILLTPWIKKYKMEDTLHNNIDPLNP